MPGYDVVSWYGVFGTGGAPAPTVERLAKEIAAVVAQPVIRDSITKRGMEASALGPAEFGNLVNADALKWDRVAKTIGPKLD